MMTNKTCNAVCRKFVQASHFCAYVPRIRRKSIALACMKCHSKSLLHVDPSNKATKVTLSFVSPLIKVIYLNDLIFRSWQKVLNWAKNI